MAFRRSLALGRQDLRLLRRDPVFFAVFLFMPLLLTVFVKPLLDAEQAVPGMAVLFALFLVNQVGWGFFREHGWNTWERLRASPASRAEVLLGKAIVPLAQLLFYMGFLFAASTVLFDLDLGGRELALAAVSTAFATTLVALAFALVALCRTAMQLNAITNLGTLLLAGLGGALTPVALLPGWAEAIAPATPSYWAMRGFREVTIDGGGLGAVLGPVAVLLAFTAAFAAIAAVRFRYDETKTSWA
jgi:ABC-2 type transport system permease protein